MVQNLTPKYSELFGGDGCVCVWQAASDHLSQYITCRTEALGWVTQYKEHVCVEERKLEEGKMSQSR